MSGPGATADVAARKRRQYTPREQPRLTMLGDFCHGLSELKHIAPGIKFPDPFYARDPVQFSRDVLGVEPWRKQAEILCALRDHSRVAVRSGHKIGKSKLAAMAALWFYCSFKFARVVMTSTTGRQVEQILWREVRMLRMRAGICVKCLQTGEPVEAPCPHSTFIDGDLGEKAITGLKSKDFREVTGFSAKHAEAVAGISGSAVLYIVDESSGVQKHVFEAIEGNRAGGAKLLLLGNPTQNEGEHYDAFHTKERFYKTFTVSSTETPNVIAGREVIPGLATREWCEEKADEWGPDSALYSIRVKGVHAEYELRKIFSVHAIGQAEARWSSTKPEGRLSIGVDPGGDSGGNDEAVFVVRRGLRMITIQAHNGLSAASHLVQLLFLLKRYRVPRETPAVIVDSEGPVGSKVYVALKEYAEMNFGAYELVRVRASERSQREPQSYDRMRDCLTASLAAWFQAGGAILEDAKLAKELHSMEWIQRADGRLKVIDKKILRKQLGRSPDRYDALALAVWEPLSLMDAPLAPPGQAPQQGEHAHAAQMLDPYQGAGSWEPR